MSAPACSAPKAFEQGDIATALKHATRTTAVYKGELKRLIPSLSCPPCFPCTIREYPSTLSYLCLLIEAKLRTPEGPTSNSFPPPPKTTDSVAEILRVILRMTMHNQGT